MKLRILTLLALLAMLVGMAACAEKATPTPIAIATEQKPTATSTSAAPEPTATVEPTREPVATFEEALCPFEVPEDLVVECGFVVVPEDHSDPGGPAIRIAVAVFKDQSDEHQPDPVMVFSGGPGERAVHNAPAWAQVFAPIHPNRDLIIFDQRGVGLSEPALECPEFVQAAFDLLDEPDPEVALETRFDALMACRDRLVSEGHNLSAYNTVQNAADVNAIRIALGYDQVNLYGGSYGSLLAQATMRDYPEEIRSVAINSVLPLEKSIFVSTTTAKAVMRLLDACAGEEACDSAYPDLQDVLFEVIDRLNAEPIPITVTNPLDGQSYDAFLTGDAVLGNLVIFLYLTQSIPVLPQAIFDVYNGDYELMTRLGSAQLALLDVISRGMLFSVLCTEDLIGRTPEDLLNVRATLPRQLFGTADPEVIVEYGIFGICENWPVKEADPWVKEPLASDIPTLVVEGEFDPVTPPEYGRLVAENLSNSYFFEFPGAGHNVVVANECARSITGAFFDDPSQAPDAACIAEMPGLVFDLPVEAAEVVLEPFTDQERGFSAVVPAGWQELAPANLKRGDTALDPTYFILEATPGTAAELLANLAGQLGLDPVPEPVASAAVVGNFTWDFYRFRRPGGNLATLALTEDSEKAYFVYLVSAPDEHGALYEAVFLPAVEAMAPLEPTATIEPSREPVATFEKAPCPFELPAGHVEGETVECGYLIVPEDRANPDSRNIRLAVAIFRHPNGAAEPDPIIYLEGGPGGSALKVRVPSFDASFGPIFAANRDIILFDQRGVGLSEPALDCPAFTELYLDLLDLEVDGQRLTAQEILDLRVEGFLACAQDLSAVADLSAYNTVANAADVNDLRIALGYDKVNLWGSSYGSRLALGVMRDFPEGVRSVVLDAPYTPEVDIYLDTPGSFDRALNVLVAACAADEACNTAYPDLRTVLFDTVERLNESPAGFEVIHPLTRKSYTKVVDGDGLLELVFRSLYDTAMRPILPQAIHDASEGTFTSFVPAASLDVWRQDIRSWGMYFSVLCNEEVPFSSLEAFRSVLAEYPEFAAFFEGFEAGGLAYAVCPDWGAGEADVRENEPIRSDIPTLIMTGQYDPIVPPGWGRQAAQTLTTSYFFEFAGMGHGASGADCPRTMMLAFLDDPTTAPDDSCTARMEVSPFVVPAQAADIELEPFASEDLGISGVAPVGWTEVGPGLFARGNPAVDMAVLQVAVEPMMSAEELLDEMAKGYGLEETPESMGERQANDLTWSLYAFAVQGVPRDLALAESEGATLIVLLRSAANERDALYEAVFLPAVEAMAPLE